METVIFRKVRVSVRLQSIWIGIAPSEWVVGDAGSYGLFFLAFFVLSFLTFREDLLGRLALVAGVLKTFPGLMGAAEGGLVC